MVPIFSIFFMIALPAYVLHRAKSDRPIKRAYLYSIGSFSFCAFAMLEELFTIKRRLGAGDIGGIEDTIGGVIVLCIGILAIALILNFITLGLCYEND